MRRKSATVISIVFGRRRAAPTATASAATPTVRAGLRKSEPYQFGSLAQLATDYGDEELAAVDQVRHGAAGEAPAQFDANLLSGLLVEHAQVVAAFEQQSLGHQDRGTLAAAPIAGVDVGGLERRIVDDAIGRLAIGNHPGVFASVEVDRGDAAVGAFDQRESHHIRAAEATRRDVRHLRTGAARL